MLPYNYVGSYEYFFIHKQILLKYNLFIEITVLTQLGYFILSSINGYYFKSYVKNFLNNLNRKLFGCLICIQVFVSTF